MKVLVVGKGAREHALCAHIAKSPMLTQLYAMPGNPGIAEVAQRVSGDEESIYAVCSWARYNKPDLVVIGPEKPLASGLADELRVNRFAVFGPSRMATEIESSKVYSKIFMDRHHIPTAPWLMATRRSTSRRIVRAFGMPVVLKADGLMAGKGVFIVDTKQALRAALDALLPLKGCRQPIIIEEKLRGVEMSATCISDGKHIVMFPDAMDYKQAFEGDRGPNTGGMGAHSPSFVLSDNQREEVELIMRKTITGLALEGRPFVGALTANLMIGREGEIHVLEFNARLGDPECVVQLARIDEDILPLLHAAACGRLKEQPIQTKSCAAVSVVLTSFPYPDNPIRGDVIEGIDSAKQCSDVSVLHAGTARNADGNLIAGGGRVLTVCATGQCLRGATNKAYRAVDAITWLNKRVRKDIGQRVLSKTST